MEKTKDIEATTIETRFIDMLEHPGDFTEQELKELLSDKTNRETLHVLQLARKAERRHRTPAPDVSEAWNAFQAKTTHAQLRRNAGFIGSLLAIAAVIVIGFFLFSRSDVFSAQPSLTKEEATARKLATGTKAIILHSSRGGTQVIPNNGSNTIDYARLLKSQEEETAGQEAQTITIPNGKDLKVILSDGTEVYLNAASSITFYVPFDKDKREVLLKGEAYFKVKHDNERPFTVNTGNVKVTVLGTEFNVRSYDKEEPRVTLVKGRVELSSVTSDEKTILHPNEEGRLNADGKLIVSTVDPYAITQWLQGYFYFENSPLSDVVKELARWYDLGIVVKNKRYLNERIHFSACRNETIGEAIDNLNQLQKANISVNGKNIVIQ